MNLRQDKVRIVIDIYRAEDIDCNESLNVIGKTISKIFTDTSGNREVLIFDDVIGRQIRVNKNIYVIMLTSYKSLLKAETVNPSIWNSYWYGEQPIVRFILSTSRAKEIKDTADFHFNRSYWIYYPYLIITDVVESNKDDIYQLFQDVGFSLNSLVFISKNADTSNKMLKVMINLIETKLINYR